jgi:hypothetical protein
MNTLHHTLSNAYVVSQWEALEVYVAPHGSTLQFNYYCLMGLGWELNVLTEEVGSSGTSSDLYLERARFESWLEHWLFWLRYFMVFLSPSTQVPEWYLILGNNCYLPHPFKCIICYHPITHAIYCELLTLSLNKLQLNKQMMQSGSINLA